MKGKDSILKSQKIIERKRKQLLRIALISLGIFLIFILIPVLVVRIPFFSIKNISVVGAKTIDVVMVEEFVGTTISGDYLKLLPRATFLTVNKKDLKNKILHEFPPIKDLKLVLHVPNTIEVIVSEREPIALWCRTEEGVETKDRKKECFFFDKDGFIYSRSPEFSSPVYIEYRNGVQGGPVGERVSTLENFSRIIKIVKGISIYGLKVQEIVFHENDVVDFNLVRGSIFLTLRGNDELTLNNLGSLLDSPKINLKYKNGWVTVSYIYLRFGNKVFYK